MAEKSYIDDIISYFENKRQEQYLMFQFRESKKENTVQKGSIAFNLFLLFILVFATFFSPLLAVSKNPPSALVIAISFLLILLPLVFFVVAVVSLENANSKESKKIIGEIDHLYIIVNVLYKIKTKWPKDVNKPHIKGVLLEFDKPFSDYRKELTELIERLEKKS